MPFSIKDYCGRDIKLEIPQGGWRVNIAVICLQYKYRNLFTWKRRSKQPFLTDSLGRMYDSSVFVSETSKQEATYFLINRVTLGSEQGRMHEVGVWLISGK